MLCQDQPHQMPRDKSLSSLEQERCGKIKGRGQTAKMWSLLEHWKYQFCPGWEMVQQEEEQSAVQG